jgi:hypothetical protein
VQGIRQESKPFRPTTRPNERGTEGTAEKPMERVSIQFREYQVIDVGEVPSKTPTLYTSDPVPASTWCASTRTRLWSNECLWLRRNVNSENSGDHDNGIDNQWRYGGIVQP